MHMYVPQKIIINIYYNKNKIIHDIINNIQNNNNNN